MCVVQTAVGRDMSWDSGAEGLNLARLVFAQETLGVRQRASILPLLFYNHNYSKAV